MDRGDRLVLRRLQLQNYRSYEAADLEFANPLYIVGLNASGKSNLADAMNFVSEAMREPLMTVLTRRGGFNEVRFRAGGRGRPPAMRLEFDLGSWGSMRSGHYSFELTAHSSYGFAVRSEAARLSLGDGATWYYTHQAGEALQTNAEGIAPHVEPTTLLLPLVGGDARFAPMHDCLSRMVSYAIEPGLMRGAQDPDAADRLRPDGSNAAAVLQRRLLNHQPRSGALIEWLRPMIPDLVDIKPVQQGNRLVLTMVQRGASGLNITFDATVLSDGSLRALGLVLAATADPPPSVLVLEEPEATIHPTALAVIRDLVHYAATHGQVVVTTHSTDLLDNRRIEADNLRLVTWRDGRSTIVPVPASAREALGSDLFSAGELLRAGQLDPAADGPAPALPQA
ncbi:MAG TPA: hypothetical protein DCZ72_14465 [Armatimonadetes bacterium]|nr:hypothetical protein [Armatimonadota bacterium]